MIKLNATTPPNVVESARRQERFEQERYPEENEEASSLRISDNTT